MSSEQASFAMLGLSTTVVRSLCTLCRLEVTTGRSAGPCGETVGFASPALEGAASDMELVSGASREPLSDKRQCVYSCEGIVALDLPASI
eukprot:scaffold1481_cov401-Prasinococcus_capsulatus_cf.AAC.15